MADVRVVVDPEPEWAAAFAAIYPLAVAVFQSLNSAVIITKLLSGAKITLSRTAHLINRPPHQCIFIRMVKAIVWTKPGDEVPATVPGLCQRIFDPGH